MPHKPLVLGVITLTVFCLTSLNNLAVVNRRQILLTSTALSSKPAAWISAQINPSSSLSSASPQDLISADPLAGESVPWNGHDFDYSQNDKDVAEYDNDDYDTFVDSYESPLDDSWEEDEDERQNAEVTTHQNPDINTSNEFAKDNHCHETGCATASSAFPPTASTLSFSTRLATSSAAIATSTITTAKGASLDSKLYSVDQASKYFVEARGRLGSLHSYKHYDARYFHRLLNDAERQKAQVDLLEAYANFFQTHKLETWLAHGTLLGWFWGQKLLPWDEDIDAQISLETLKDLAAHYNGTVFSPEMSSRSSKEASSQVVMSKHNSSDSSPPYPSPVHDSQPSSSTDSYPSISQISSSPASDPSRRYLLDVNPASIHRWRGRGQNIIDARWIDLNNGLYIDITALAELEPNRRPGWWSCKNSHHYRTEQIWPLQTSKIHGFPIAIPAAPSGILEAEYGTVALTDTDYRDHRWNVEQSRWIPKTKEEIRADLEATNDLYVTTNAHESDHGRGSHLSYASYPSGKPQVVNEDLRKA